jgi:hypothetical protein
MEKNSANTLWYNSRKLIDIDMVLLYAYKGYK